MQNYQTSTSDRSSQVFSGIRFVLLGFDPIKKAQVSRKLVTGGGIDAGQYGPNCTHVIVDKVAYDDPICVAARQDGKMLVSRLWVDHSFDVGHPVDTTSVMYMPARDLNGIPGAKSLVICLTGYQREDREDIMNMVEVMGAQFSKPLIATKVTHLICYKFEGEKYLLAKKMKIIKLINHRWLEDCLKAWEILPEADYSKSGYELEKETEAKDSEDEAEGVNRRNSNGIIATPNRSLLFNQEIPKTVSTTSNSKEVVSSAMKTTSNHFINPHEIENNTENIISKPSNLYLGTTSGSAAENNFVNASNLANKSPLNEAKKAASPNYSSKSPMRTTPAKIYMNENTSNTFNVNDAFTMCNSLLKKGNDEQRGLSGSQTGPAFCPENVQKVSTPAKRKMDISGGSSKLKKTSHTKEKLNRENLNVENDFHPVEKCNHLPARTESPSMSSISKGKNVNSPLSKTSAPEIVQDEDFVSMQKPQEENVIQELEKSSSAVSSDLQKSNTSTGRKKTVAKKFSAPKKKTVSAKGSIFLKNNELKNDATTSTTVDEKNVFEYQKLGTEIDMVVNDVMDDVMQVENVSENKSSFMDDETEPPEDNLGQNNEKDDMMCVKNNVLLDKSDVSENVVSDKGKSKGKKRSSLSVKQVSNKKTPKNKEITTENDNKKLEIREATAVKIKNNLEKSVEIERAEGVFNDPEPKNDEEVVVKKRKNNSLSKTKKNAAISIKEVTENKELTNHKNNEKPEIVKDGCNDPEHKNNEDDDSEIVVKKMKKKRTLNKAKKDDVSSVEEVIDKFDAEKKEHSNNNIIEKPEITKDGYDDPEQKNNEDDGSEIVVKKVRKNRTLNKKDAVFSVKDKSDAEKKEYSNNNNNIKEKPEVIEDDRIASKKNKRPLSKTKKDATDSKAVKGKVKVKPAVDSAQKENIEIAVNKQVIKKITTPKSVTNAVKDEAKWFILTGNQLQRRELQQIIRKLKGKICRVSHQWSYQATHYIVPEPIKRNEKFFAAAASGSWILKTDYLSASNEGGKFVAEEDYEWHKSGLSEDGQISLEAPRKWRLLKEKTGHGAFYGMRIVIYGDCIAPTLDTLKRVIKAGDGTILATSPPYTRFLNTNTDFAIISPGMPHVDIWVQEFIKHEIPCISADYLVEYVCKPGYPLEKHTLYDTNIWAERSCNNLKNRLNEETSEPETPHGSDVACEVCKSRDRGDEMLICGDESGAIGCGAGTHIDCCDPPFDDVPDNDWFCPKCSKPEPSSSTRKKSGKKKGK